MNILYDLKLKPCHSRDHIYRQHLKEHNIRETAPSRQCSLHPFQIIDHTYIMPTVHRDLYRERDLYNAFVYGNLHMRGNTGRRYMRVHLAMMFNVDTHSVYFYARFQKAQ